MAVTAQGVQVLRLADVWKSFDGVDALKGVTFEAQAGEIHALLGRERRGQVHPDGDRRRLAGPGPRLAGAQRRAGRGQRRRWRCASAGCPSPTSIRPWSPTSPCTRTSRCGCPTRSGAGRPGRRGVDAVPAGPGRLHGRPGPAGGQPERGPAPAARGGQVAGRRPGGADPGRADRLARRRRDRDPVRRAAPAGGQRGGRGLHHPPAGRGARAVPAGHRAAGRRGPRQLRRRRRHRRPAARAHRRPRGDGRVPGQGGPGGRPRPSAGRRATSPTARSTTCR